MCTALAVTAIWHRRQITRVLRSPPAAFESFRILYVVLGVCVYGCAQHRIIYIIIILSIQQEYIYLMPAISESVEYAPSVEINDQPPLTFDLSNWIQRAASPPDLSAAVAARRQRDTRHSFYCSRPFSVKSIRVPKVWRIITRTAGTAVQHPFPLPRPRRTRIRW